MVLAWLYMSMYMYCEERQQAGLEEGSFEVSAVPTGRLPGARLF